MHSSRNLHILMFRTLTLQWHECGFEPRCRRDVPVFCHPSHVPSNDSVLTALIYRRALREQFMMMGLTAFPPGAWLSRNSLMWVALWPGLRQFPSPHCHVMQVASRTHRKWAVRMIPVTCRMLALAQDTLNQPLRSWPLQPSLIILNLV